MMQVSGIAHTARCSVLKQARLTVTIMLFVCLFSLFCVSSLTTNASESELFEYDVNTYFRGVWVTPKDSGNIGNIKPTASKTKEQKIEAYKAEVLRILDIMEWYNLNALILHRPHWCLK